RDWSSDVCSSDLPRSEGRGLRGSDALRRQGRARRSVRRSCGMKYFPLIWAGLWRKRARTCLTALSIVVAFSLFGIMNGVTAGLDDAIEGLTEETRLMTQSRINIIEPLPLAFLTRIESIDGVDYVVPYGYFGGYYQEPRNQINTGAVYIDRMFELYPEFVVPEDQIETMMR